MSARNDKGRHFLFAAVWAALALAVFVGVRGTNHTDFSHTVETLSKLRGAQAELDRALLHVRIDESSDPGSIGPVLASVEQAEGRVKQVLEATGDAELAREAEGYAEALRKASGIVTRYATQCTMWRAEMHAWQTALPETPGQHTPPETLDAARLTRVRQLETDMSGCLAAVEAERLSARCEALLATYTRWYGSNLALAETFRIGFFLVSGILLLHLLRRSRILNARVHELESANVGLVDRFQEGAQSERERVLLAESTQRVLDTVLTEAREEEQAAMKAEEADRQARVAALPRPVYTPSSSKTEPEMPLLPPDENLMQLVGDAIERNVFVPSALSVEQARCAPGDILGDVYAALVRKADERGIELSVVWETKVPARVRTDPFRLEQVLKILVGNAIKYTQRGRVTVSVAYELPTEPEDSACLCFTIQDTGVGMDEKELARLTEGKHHADGAGGKDQYGSGQGLSLCMHLVESMGGSIWVRSKKRQGSVFVFRIEAGALDSPLEHPELGRTRPEEWSSGAAATYLDGVRVLLTESGDDVERLGRHFLVRAGAIVACASDGAEAVRRVLLAETEGEPFDVVLMDMEMNIVDGYEGTRRLRASGYVRPIVALSHSTLVSDSEACLTAGCDDYLSKPLRSSDLLTATARWAHHDGDGQPPRSVPPPPLPSKVPEAPEAPEAAEADLELIALVREFFAELESELAEMRKALAAADRTRVATLAHRLKGAAGSYGFPEITRQAGDVEAAVQAEFEAADVEREIEALEALCKKAATEAGAGAPFPAKPAETKADAALQLETADGSAASTAPPETPLPDAAA